MTNRFDDAWRAFAERDQQLQAPADLERRILTAVEHARDSASPASPQRRSYAWVAAAATVAIAVTAGVTRQKSPPPIVPALESRAHPAVMLPASIAMAPAHVRTTAPARPLPDSEWLAREDDMRVILMMFGTTPALPSEPLQLVRLRIPKEALLGLGVALFEPDTDGTVDVDVLVGEDGLPKDIRKVRITQEER